jgi:hypothetical protein
MKTSTTAKNAKQRLDEHERHILGLAVSLDGVKRVADEDRTNTTGELAELATRVDALEFVNDRRWAVRLNRLVRRVWRR